MRDALVIVSPRKMQTNSPANSTPASRPAPSVPSSRKSGVPRRLAHPHTSTVAIAERSPA